MRALLLIYALIIVATLYVCGPVLAQAPTPSGPPICGVRQYCDGFVCYPRRYCEQPVCDVYGWCYIARWWV